VVVTHRLVAHDLLNRTSAKSQTPHQAGISVSKIALNFGRRDGPQARQWPSIDRSIDHQLTTSPQYQNRRKDPPDDLIGEDPKIVALRQKGARASAAPSGRAPSAANPDPG